MTGIKLPEQNLVALIGRLTFDPDLRFTQKGQAVCRFDLAVNRRYKDATTGEWKDDAAFIPVVVWRQAAERCKEKLKKGSPVQVEGRLKSREYEDKSGQKRRVLEVEARRVQFLAAASPASSASAVQDQAPPSASSAAQEAGSEETDLEEIPF